MRRVAAIEPEALANEHGADYIWNSTAVISLPTPDSWSTMHSGLPTPPVRCCRMIPAAKTPNIC